MPVGHAFTTATWSLALLLLCRLQVLPVKLGEAALLVLKHESAGLQGKLQRCHDRGARVGGIEALLSSHNAPTLEQPLQTTEQRKMGRLSAPTSPPGALRDF